MKAICSFVAILLIIFSVLLYALNRCSIQHNILKFFGHCNDIDRAMRKCLKKEYEENRARNREKRQRLINAHKASEK